MTLGKVETITAFAEKMSEFLTTSELTETKAFVHSFVREIEVKLGRAVIIYSIPTPEDSPTGGVSAAEVALKGGVRKSVRHGGPGRTDLRTFRWEVGLPEIPRPPIAKTKGETESGRSLNKCPVSRRRRE